MTQLPATSTSATTPPRSRAGLAPSIIGLVVGVLAVGAASLILLVAGGYGLFVTMFGAPGHVSLSGLAVGAWVALPVVAPLAVIALGLGILALVRRRVATPTGALPSRGALVLAIMALVLGGLCAAGMLASIPLLLVEQCYSTQPCTP